MIIASIDVAANSKDRVFQQNRPKADARVEPAKLVERPGGGCQVQALGPMDKPHLSIRAASWSAAQCVRRFCRLREISNVDVDAFCQHLENAAIADSVVAWSAEGDQLRISGLGDPLPQALDGIAGLNDLLCAAREVTETQMFAAWTPLNVLYFLRSAATLAGLEPNQVVECTARLHRPDHNGWGAAVDIGERDSWSLGI